ncbi:MAG: ABC transporter ATP-binding protein, partial [Anaerolineae bacterium]|nr:ABC transporter ATP-binding protein [Anaerolineae bacterium]
MFDGLDAEAYDRSYSDIALARRIFRYLATQRRYVMMVVGTVLLISLADLVQPIVISQGVGALVDSPGLGLLIGMSILVLLASCAGWVANLVRRRASGRAVGNMVRDLRVDAFKAAIQRDMSFYDEFVSGKIVSRITSDTQDFAQVVVLVTDLLSQLIVLFVLIGILLSIEWRLTLILCGLSVLIFIAALAFRRAARYVSRQGSRVLANVNSNIQESVAGITVAKNFRQEKALYNTFDAINRQAYRINWWRGFVLATIFPVLNLLGGVGTGVLIYTGALTAQEGLISVGAWYLFVRSLQNFWDPLMNIASFWGQFQSGLAAAERIFALIDAEPVVVQTDNQTVGPLKGEITFEGVRFQYTSREVVLPGLDLHIRPGENVAFVGHTGAGKSSVAKLVARFYEFQGGRLLVDARDIRTLDLHEYRRQLGYVPQSPFLFSGTVLDNIRYARPEATDAEIEAIARQIGEGEWIEALPQGLHSNVGERGARLSMGQRQLVALVRVLVQQPAIFILDEATASIDPFTEAQIQ